MEMNSNTITGSKSDGSCPKCSRAWSYDEGTRYCSDCLYWAGAANAQKRDEHLASIIGAATAVPWWAAAAIVLWWIASQFPSH